jgi:hypothetical protein
MACPHCGSWAVKADRSLGGRMVCGRCGRPLGRDAERGVGRPRLPLPTRPCWGLVLLVAVAAGLAWLAESRPPASSPPAAPGWTRPGQRGGPW